MYAEKEFEEWWDVYCKTHTYKSERDRCVAHNAFLAGRQAAIDSVNSLPHRAMFDAGVEQGIKEGRKQGLEEAEGIAEPIGRGSMCSNVGPVVAAAIRQRIEEWK